MTDALPELADVTHRWIRVHGVRLHVAEAGDPAAPVAMLVHGWPQHWWAWRKVIPALAERYRVVCPDLRGFGWSDAPDGPYDKLGLAEDLAALIERLGAGPVRLAGHDWGGVAGFLLALRRPELVSRYVALNTGHPWMTLDLRSWRAVPGSLYQWVLGAPGLGRRLVEDGRLVALMFRLGSSKDGTWTPEDVESFVDRLREPRRAQASSRLYRTFVTREMPAALRGRGPAAGLRLTVPTLMLHGTRDPVLPPALLRGYEAHADDMRVELVEGCGHFIAEERPDVVVERLLRFLA